MPADGNTNGSRGTVQTCALLARVPDLPDLTRPTGGGDLVPFAGSTAALGVPHVQLVLVT